LFEMMKKIFAITLLLSVFATGAAWAQCTPNPNSGSLFSPAPTAPLPSGTVGSAYAQVITVNVPADTTIDLGSLIGFPFPPQTVTVNDLTLGVINGLPIGIFGSNNPGSGIILGGARGCIDIAGTPTTSGQYVVNIPTTLSFVVPNSVPVIGGSTQTIPGQVPYNMEIASVVGVTPANGFHVSQTQPNPSAGITVIRYSVSAVSDMRLEVMNLAGAMVYTETQTAISGDQSFRFDVSDFAPGMYLYRVTDGKNSVARKMVVN
jgi:hypothetical protein